MNPCNGNCDQGRKECPTPQACFLPEADLELSVDWAFVLFHAALVLVAVLGVIWVILEAK